MEDEIGSGRPHTKGGLMDMLMYGKCFERCDAHGVWHHIPMPDWPSPETQKPPPHPSREA